MARKLSTLAELADWPFDDIIDVRSPAEFAEDHVPGAINLPVLDDAQRAEVGTIYVQDDPFRARKIGGALVAENAARHLRDALADKGGGWRPLVYCWRGGQRSGSFTTILQQVGWRAEVLEGGYKTYRRLVAAALHDAPVPHRIILIDGPTGCAKTDLLEALARQGAQILDLEGAAQHRGSLFGATGPQPSQKAFESRIAMALAKADPAQPLFVEAESNRIGKCLVPPTLWKAMRAAPAIRLRASVPLRAAYTVRAYADMLDDTGRLGQTLDLLRPFQPAERIDTWHKMAADAKYERLAAELMIQHYDPRYARSADGRVPLATLDVQGMDAAALDGLAAKVIAVVS